MLDVLAKYITYKRLLVLLPLNFSQLIRGIGIVSMVLCLKITSVMQAGLASHSCNDCSNPAAFLVQLWCSLHGHLVYTNHSSLATVAMTSAIQLLLV